MSLTRDGVWKAGVWAPTVWASGVWFEAVAEIVEAGLGGIDFLRKKKTRKTFRPVKYSEYEKQEARIEKLATKLALASVPMDEDMDAIDDEILLKALTVVLH